MLSVVNVGSVICAAALVASCSSVDGGGGSGQCPFVCPTLELVAFHLSCSPNDLSQVVVTGPCAMPDASLASYTDPYNEQLVSVGSPRPGTCHVELVFANGFVYATDVSFAFQNVGCGCASFVGPTSGGSVSVNNPSDTCVALDAGVTG